ncbi:MAG: AraC family transcriptional regulator [Clostridia bacterium]|nr:AraC family transcriptional regulator [Clostridia bacterium]
MFGIKIDDNPHITKVYTTYSWVFQPDYRFKGESHDFWELVCVTDGSISVAADNEIFELTAGQAILHNPMQFHNITVTGNSPTSVSVFTFSGENIPNIQNHVCEIPDISEIKALHELAFKNYDIKSGLIIKDIKTEGIDYLVYIKRLELLLIKLATHCVKGQSNVSQKAKNYLFIVNTMVEHIGERLSVSDLAALCNMSVINLQKSFSYYAGVGVMEYFNRQKMRYAAELLRSGASVREAALSVGFQDQNYFSTVFKRITGHTPSSVKCN